MLSINDGSGNASATNGKMHTTKPGSGWTNGDVPQAMFPLTRDGKVMLYSTHRRWINDHSSWTRIGDGTELDAVHSHSEVGKSTVHSPEEESRTVRAIVAQLCERFYQMGWATGTGGGCSIRVGGPDEGRPWRVFVAPSGVQKEDMIGDDIFELDMEGKVVEPPRTPHLRQSACTPLWYVVYRNRPSARAVIHTHSINAQMATLLDQTESSPVLRITHLEMLKGTGGHAYDDVLEVPIIDNRPTEDQLADQLDETLRAYPRANAVLVRRHGLYCWGDSWEQAKTQCESFDYLFESAVRMRSMGIDCGVEPCGGSYRRRVTAIMDEDETNEQDFAKTKKRPAEDIKVGGDCDESEVVSKRSREEGNTVAGTGFNNASMSANSADLVMTPMTIPLLPRNSKVLLLDIEGCTTSISSVKDELFPYIVENISTFVDGKPETWLIATLDELVGDVTNIKDEKQRVAILNDKSLPSFDKNHADTVREAVVEYVKLMVKNDVKATGLKKLQGQMWEAGYKSGKLKGHVYPDFKPTMEWCKSHNVSVYIYSSGSIQAQKLLFAHSIEGDLLSYMSGHFDTTTGGKKESESYVKIAKALNVSPSDIVFVSDAEGELVAAKDAGVGFPVMSVRPGNVPLTDVGRGFRTVFSLMQLCGV